MDLDLNTALNKKLLTQKHKKYIIYQIAAAIKYIHSADLIHRDIKPSNILINTQSKIKICDFGLVRSVNDDD
jgi:mitogen-activated protein kinase 15